MISTEKPENPDTSLYQVLIGQVYKGIRRMPWHWEPMKDVVSCDKLGLGANSRLTPRCPNEETHLW